LIWGIFALIVVLALATLPQIWVRSVMAQHSADRPDFPGTGGEFARHLLDEMKLVDVGVEQTQIGDHYDPISKTVRLSTQNYSGRSLTAVTVAAHEVGHAMQDATGYPPLSARTRLAKLGAVVEKVGMVVLLAAPLMAVITRHPAGFLLEAAAGMLLIGFTVLIHLFTLPTEFDASFRRALPILKAGQYIPERDMPAARSILRAAAFTYVAGTLISLINIARWLRILRF
jgi:Zn-dependent membrane protease YugP